MRSPYLHWVDSYGCARRLTLFQRAHRWVAMLLGVSAVCFVASCTDEDAARRHLRNQGYTEIRLTGYDAFACAKDDTTCTGFSALSPAGHRVYGAVGCGIGCGKACTIRFE